MRNGAICVEGQKSATRAEKGPNFQQIGFYNHLMVDWIAQDTLGLRSLSWKARERPGRPPAPASCVVCCDIIVEVTHAGPLKVACDWHRDYVLAWVCAHVSGIALALARGYDVCEEGRLTSETGSGVYRFARFLQAFVQTYACGGAVFLGIVGWHRAHD